MGNLDEKIKIIDELFRQTQELRTEVQALVRNSQELSRRLSDETEESLQAINREMREIMFGLMDKERRIFYKKSKHHTYLEKHEAFMKKLDSDFRKENAFTDIVEINENRKRLKKLNDSQHEYDENHKFLLFFDRAVDKVLQGYIVQFLCFLITGESYGRYEGYWNKNELSVNDIEDIGKNHGEKLEVNISLVINDIKNSITNTLCFFSPSNEPEEDEASNPILTENKMR